MLYGLASSAAHDEFAKYWVEYEITIGLKYGSVVGGVALAGCPYLPYLATPNGDNIANFGIPREIRISWTPMGDEGYLDAEQQFTQQLPNWHSGFHILAFGPVRTRILRLRLSTFPGLLSPNAAAFGVPTAGRMPKPQLPVVPGFLIPFLYVFAHQENVVFQPHVPAGLLAAWQTPVARQDTYATCIAAAGTPALAAADPADLVRITPSGGSGRSSSLYRVYSAASALSTPRVSTNGTGFTEFFCSNPMRETDSVTIVFAQARQNEASVAGVRLTAPNHTEMPGEPYDGDLFELVVYESDLPQGGEALDRSPGNRLAAYRVRLVTQEFALSDAVNGLDVRFLRPSNARTFTMTFRALTAGRSALAIRELELIQSAQVTLAPKAARRVQVRQLNFRLIGANLASEFDKLGDGAAFEVVRRSGAGRSESLFRAESLLDLIERTGAKLYRNGRAWEVVEETAHSEGRTRGWQRRESGKDLRWTHADYDALRVPSVPPRPEWSSTPTQATFRSMGNQETRTHTEQLGYQNDASTRSVLQYVNRLVRSATADDDEQFVAPVGLNADRLVSGFARAWHGLPDGKRDKIKTMRGIYNLNVPPHALATSYLSSLNTLLTSNADPGAVSNAMLTNIAGGGLLSGATVSVGASASAIFVGANVSYTLGQQLPAASRVVQMGDTGTIQLQATDAYYQYTQTLNHGFDDATQVRQVLDRKRDVLSAPEIMWQGRYVDIVSGRIPLALAMEALGSHLQGNPDVAVIVRCLGLNSVNVRADIWFDLTEEEVRDDY